MKFLAFSDNHASYMFTSKLIEQGKKADFLVAAGDFTHFGRFWKEFLTRLTILELPLWVVSGNHEACNYKNLMKKISLEFPFVHDLESQPFSMNGVSFIGCSYMDSEDGVPFPSSSYGKPLVFVTHTPPSGCEAAMTENGKDGGSDRVRTFVEQIQPDLVLCGHIHKPLQRESRIRKSRITNIACECRLFQFQSRVFLP